MQIERLDHINMTVHDFAESADWYARIFGFTIVEEDVLEDGAHWGVLRAGETMLCIYEYPDLTHEDRFALAKRGLHRISHFGFRVTDRAAWEATMEREGLPVLYGGPLRWSHSTSWYITDPTGYEIEVALWDDATARFDPEQVCPPAAS